MMIPALSFYPHRFSYHSSTLAAKETDYICSVGRISISLMATWRERVTIY
jgi:hypothetical protein